MISDCISALVTRTGTVHYYAELDISLHCNIHILIFQGSKKKAAVLCSYFAVLTNTGKLNKERKLMVILFLTLVYNTVTDLCKGKWHGFMVLLGPHLESGCLILITLSAHLSSNFLYVSLLTLIRPL